MFDKSKIKGVIFDLDGVICSTDELHYQAWKALADEIGVYFDRQINGRLRGVSRMASLEIILEKSDKTYSEEEKLALAEKKNDVYRKLLGKMGPEDVSDEVRSTLVALRERGYRLSIGSSSKNTPLILERTDARRYFDAVSDGNNITRSKPDPEGYLLAAHRLGVAPQQAFVFEDSLAGLQAGRAGGMTVIGLATTLPAEKIAPLADRVIDHFVGITPENIIAH